LSQPFPKQTLTASQTICHSGEVAEIFMPYDIIHLITAIVLTPGGSSTVQIYTHTKYTEQNSETEYPRTEHTQQEKYTNITIRIHNLQN
jgi:hypothetical protein